MNADEYVALADALHEHVAGINAQTATVDLLASHRVWLVRADFAVVELPGGLIDGSAGGGSNLAVTATGFPDDRETALKVARSVVPDDVSTVELYVEFGWLPNIPHALTGVSASPESSLVFVSSGGFSVLSVGTSDLGADDSLLAQATPVTVRGISAQWFRSDALIQLWLPLTDGRTLTVSGTRGSLPTGATVTIADDDLVRVVEDLRIGPRAAYAWIGTR